MKTKILADLWYTVRYDVLDGRLVFMVSKIDEISMDGSTVIYRSARLGGVSTHNVEEAEEFLVGYVKFDGCLEAQFTNDIHLCHRLACGNMGKLLEFLHDLASTALPDWVGS